MDSIDTAKKDSDACMVCIGLSWVAGVWFRLSVGGGKVKEDTVDGQT